MSKGFTLLEFLIYTAILAGLIPFIGGIFVYSQRGSGQVEARSVVNYNIRLALERIRQDLKSAATVSIPFRGAEENTLTMELSSGDVTYALSEGRITRQVDSGTQENITSDQVTISDMHFRKFQNRNRSATTFAVSIDTSITGSYDSENPDYSFTETRTKSTLVEGVFGLLRSQYGVPSEGVDGYNCLVGYDDGKRYFSRLLLRVFAGDYGLCSQIETFDDSGIFNIGL